MPQVPTVSVFEEIKYLWGENINEITTYATLTTISILLVYISYNIIKQRSFKVLEFLGLFLANTLVNGIVFYLIKITDNAWSHGDYFYSKNFYLTLIFAAITLYIVIKGEDKDDFLDVFIATVLSLLTVVISNKIFPMTSDVEILKTMYNYEVLRITAPFFFDVFRSSLVLAVLFSYIIKIFSARKDYITVEDVNAKEISLTEEGVSTLNTEKSFNDSNVTEENTIDEKESACESSTETSYETEVVKSRILKL